MKIDKRHPRYFSLILRERLVRGVKIGITSEAGLIAHGRGEAFDYLLGEKTQAFAKKAISAAAAYLLAAKKPVISVNGNTCALCAKEVISLARSLDCKIEVNLFHYSKSRARKIEAYLKKIDAGRILESTEVKKTVIPGIASARAISVREGIGESDCILMPLEDGDRAQALRKTGKKIIAVDLNPLSRTARSATVTIIDNIVRSLPLLCREIVLLKHKNRKELEKIISKYDNKTMLDEAEAKIRYDKRGEKTAK